MSDFSRRKFLKTGAAALAGITIAPSSILGMSHGHVSPTDKLNLAAVGIGGMGHANINNVKGTENIVALCDVDWKYAKGVFDEFPNAKKYWDYRKMYDEMGKSIDGVIIATADHTHAIITADAMTMGKHVYCQKPLTHSVYESRLLTKLAASTGVVTQMGNQGASGEGTDLVCEWIWNGEIGEVTKVYFDYFIIQAYKPGSDSNLDKRLIDGKVWGPGLVETFGGVMTEEVITRRTIMTENFEATDAAMDGGYPYTDRYGNSMKSLEGMARWQPRNGFRNVPEPPPSTSFINASMARMPLPR